MKHLEDKEREARRLRKCEREREWRAENPDLVMQRNRAYYAKNAERLRAYGRARYATQREIELVRSRVKNFARNYNLTRDEARAILATKPTSCDVCKREVPRICFDHDHNTGSGRGWLCDNCNTTLGATRDDPVLLRRLII